MQNDPMIWCDKDSSRHACMHAGRLADKSNVISGECYNFNLTIPIFIIVYMVLILVATFNTLLN